MRIPPCAPSAVVLALLLGAPASAEVTDRGSLGPGTRTEITAGGAVQRWHIDLIVDVRPEIRVACPDPDALTAAVTWTDVDGQEQRRDFVRDGSDLLLIPEKVWSPRIMSGVALTLVPAEGSAGSQLCRITAVYRQEGAADGETPAVSQATEPAAATEAAGASRLASDAVPAVQPRPSATAGRASGAADGGAAASGTSAPVDGNAATAIADEAPQAGQAVQDLPEEGGAPATPLTAGEAAPADPQMPDVGADPEGSAGAPRAAGLFALARPEDDGACSTTTQAVALKACRVTVASGETVDIPIHLVNGGSLTALTLEATTDGTVLQPVSADLAPAIEGLSAARAQDATLIRVALAFPASPPDNAPVAHLRYYVVGDPGALSPLRLRVIEAFTADGPARVSVLHGRVSVEATETPDAVMFRSAANQVLRMVAGLEEVDIGLDLDEDGQLTAADAAVFLDLAGPLE